MSLEIAGRTHSVSAYGFPTRWDLPGRWCGSLPAPAPGRKRGGRPAVSGHTRSGPTRRKTLRTFGQEGAPAEDPQRVW